VTPRIAAKFAGYYRDSPGQGYAMARYYSANTGSFWSPDPGGIKTAHAGDPTSWNRYAYTTGDPINFRDPSGRDDCWADACVNAPEWCSGDEKYYDASCGSDSGGGGGGEPDDQARGGGGSSTVAHQPGSTTGPFGFGATLSVLKTASKDCLKDIGATGNKQATDALVNSTILYKDGLVPTIDPVTGATTNGAVPADSLGNTITIYLNFGYADPSNVSANSSTGGSFSFNLLASVAAQMGVDSINTSQYWDLLLLHELGHMLGIPQETAGSDYNGNIFRDCISH
jgi:RHS repeat-associated protein